LRATDQYANFYTTYFLKPQPRTKYSLVVVFENQRYVPLVGWSSANLLTFTDHAKFSDLAGRRFPEACLEGAFPPRGHQWASAELPAGHDHGRDSQPPQPLGLFGFEVDQRYTSTDPEGWTYALSFRRIQAHLTENSSHYFRKSSDFVRRRRWVRLVD
jgi:hypothetical protein